VIGPLTLRQWLAELRRRGVQCRLAAGRVRISGLRKLEAAERAALFASAEQVKELLRERAQRRRAKRKTEQAAMATTEPQRPRRVVGHHVVPGYPQLSRLLYEDEVKQISPTQRARGLPSHRWRLFI
jgi:hypothetical protein